MSTGAAVRLMTTDEMLAMPDDGMVRELLRGELRERPMIFHDRWHNRAAARIACVLIVWLETRPEPRGLVVSGAAGFRLARDPDTTVGIDVAYVSLEVAARAPETA